MADKTTVSVPPSVGRAPIQDWPPWNPDGTIKNSWLAWFTGITSSSQGASNLAGLGVQNLLGIIPENVSIPSVIITSVALAMSLIQRQNQDSTARNLATIAQALQSPQLRPQIVDRFAQFLNPQVRSSLTPEQAALTALLITRPIQPDIDAAGLTQTLTTFLPSVEINGSATGITYASQVGEWLQIGNLNVLFMSIELDAIGSGTGAVTISLPSPLPIAAYTGGGFFTSLLRMSGLTGTPTAEIFTGTTTVALYETGATGSAALTNTNLAAGTPGSSFNLVVVYQN